MNVRSRISHALRERAISDLPVDSVRIGLTWTLLESANGAGLAMTPGNPGRTLPWSGTLSGRPLNELQAWFGSWNALECAVGLAAVNATLNTDNPLQWQAQHLHDPATPNLAVFEHYLPQLDAARVVVIGQYPGLSGLVHKADLVVTERLALDGTLPDTAAPYLLPDADWVFLTGTSLINQSFEFLCDLAHKATLVLMGPSVPWFDGLTEYGVDILAGTVVDNRTALGATVMEAGGTRIFDQGIHYALLDLRESELERWKKAIVQTVAQRDTLKARLAQCDALTRRDVLRELDLIDARLSRCDTEFNRLWNKAGRSTSIALS